MQIELQAFEARDFDRLIGWISAPDDLHQWAGLIFEFPLTSEQLQTHLETAEKMHRRLYKAVDVESGEAVGHAELSHIWHGLSGRVSRMIVGDPAQRGRGIGTQMTKRVVELGFDEFEFDRMDIGAIATNEVAVTCYRNAGFRSVGIWRDAMTLPNGNIDVHWLTIFRSHWVAN
ncbi:MAG: GNAT family protein [Rhodospirillales bacterium]|nr:GNAT family protein [Rhodospirillales bacterium]